MGTRHIRTVVGQVLGQIAGVSTNTPPPFLLPPTPRAVRCSDRQIIPLLGSRAHLRSGDQTPALRPGTTFWVSIRAPGAMLCLICWVPLACPETNRSLGGRSLPLVKAIVCYLNADAAEAVLHPFSLYEMRHTVTFCVHWRPGPGASGKR